MDQIDYSDAKFKFQGIRKHFFKDVIYNITVFDDMFVMGTTIDTQNPKYRVLFRMETIINWELRKNKVELDCFEFPYRNSKKTIHAKPKDLLMFKEFLSGKVTFEGIGDLYIPMFQIGKGSSAKVYSAKCVLDQQIYAVKAIEKSFLKLSENNSGQVQFNVSQQALQQEIQILRTISPYEHNFLVFKEMYEGDTTIYLVTSFLEGHSLSEEIEKAKNLPDKRLPINVIRNIIQKLLCNLRILHSHRIIHRDLKPDNLMFEKKNDFSSLVLVDFGLATSELLDKFLFPKCGTPGYVAPEVLTSKKDSKYTCKVDLFSTGCICYKLLTGHSLFTGQNFDEVLRSNKHCHVDLDLPIDGVYITDASLDFLKRLLQKNPKNRITAVQALSHPFLDSNTDYSTQVIQPQSGQFAVKNIILQLNLAEFESKYNSQNDINDEQQNQKIQDVKRYSHEFQQMPLSAKRGSGQLSAKRGSEILSGTFYLKDPLSAMHGIQLKGMKKSCSPTQF